MATRSEDYWERAVRPYIVQRLRSECVKHGDVRSLADRAGLSPAHVSNVKNEKGGIAEDAAAKLAAVWNMDLAQLINVAMEWSRGTGHAWRHPELEEASAMRRWSATALAVARQLDDVWPAGRRRTVGQWFDVLTELDGPTVSS